MKWPYKNYFFPFSIRNATRPSGGIYLVLPTVAGKVDATKKTDIAAKQDFSPIGEKRAERVVSIKNNYRLKKKRSYYITFHRNNAKRMS